MIRAARVTHLMTFMALAVGGVLLLPGDLGTGLPGVAGLLSERVPTLVAAVAVLAAVLASVAVFRRLR